MDELSEDDNPGHELLIVQPPFVLEPSHLIIIDPSLALQGRHYGYHVCGDNLDKMIQTST